VTDTAFDHPLPWTESEYFALGETMSRVELIDGCLLVSPPSGFAHQRIMSGLLCALDESAGAAGLSAVHMVNLRLGPGRIANPDLVVNDGTGAEFVDAATTVLVGEVASENSAIADRILKRQLYAEAGIGWYLLAEPSAPDCRSVTLRLLRLAGDHYVKHAVAERGQVLRSDHPFPLAISTNDLVKR
jgi:Uma2 family endonuclease